MADWLDTVIKVGGGLLGGLLGRGSSSGGGTYDQIGQLLGLVGGGVGSYYMLKKLADAEADPELKKMLQEQMGSMQEEQELRKQGLRRREDIMNALQKNAFLNPSSEYYPQYKQLADEMQYMDDARRTSIPKAIGQLINANTRGLRRGDNLGVFSQQNRRDETIARAVTQQRDELQRILTGEGSPQGRARRLMRDQLGGMINLSPQFANVSQALLGQANNMNIASQASNRVLPRAGVQFAGNVLNNAMNYNRGNVPNSAPPQSTFNYDPSIYGNDGGWYA